MGKIHEYYRKEEPFNPESWKAYYQKTRFSSYTNERELGIIQKIVKPQRGEIILDAGCGFGRIVERIVPISEVVGTDISRRMVEYCSKNFADGFKGLVADIEKMPFKDEKFDKCVCVGVLMHVEHPDKAIEEFSRILKPGGTIVIENTNLLLLYFTVFYSLLFLVYDTVKWIIRSKFPRPIVRYRSPFWYKRLLERSGFKVENIVGDTFIGVLRIKKVTLFPPKFSLPFFKKIDSLLSSRWPFKYFCFGSYIQGRKQR
jgi:ubiquinone/menaquinone biosynthesis C-methylase UbiE